MDFHPEPADVPPYLRILGIAAGVPADLVPDWHRDRERVLSDPRMASDEPVCSADGAELLPAPRLVDVPRYPLADVHLVSPCSASWPRDLAAPIIDVFDTVLAAGSCYDLPRAGEATDALATCTMYEDLARDAPFDCDDLSGRAPVGMADGRRRCEIAQQPPTGEGESPSPGWLMDGGSTWGERLCGSSPWRYLRFTPEAQPMPGSRVWLECLECTDLRGASPDGGP